MGVTLLEELALLEALPVCQFTHVMSLLPLGVCPALSQFFFFFFLADRLEQSHECFKSKVDT